MTGILRRRLIRPILEQLRQGTSPSKLALTVGAGIALGIFPVIGTTTILCLLIGSAFKLNHPTLQAINYLLYPLQIPLVIVFVRAGEWMFNAPHLSFSPYQVIAYFRAAGLAQFLEKYWAAGLYGIAAWSLTAPVLICVCYWSLAPIFKSLAGRKQISSENP